MTSQNETGQDRTGQDRTGQDRTETVSRVVEMRSKKFKMLSIRQICPNPCTLQRRSKKNEENEGTHLEGIAVVIQIFLNNI